MLAVAMSCRRRLWSWHGRRRIGFKSHGIQEIMTKRKSSQTDFTVKDWAAAGPVTFHSPARYRLISLSGPSNATLSDLQ
jgi:hypothetical protein